MKTVSVLLIGALVVTAIDHLLGMKYTGISGWVVLVHKIVFMLWGVAIGALIKR